MGDLNEGTNAVRQKQLVPLMFFMVDLNEDSFQPHKQNMLLTKTIILPFANFHNINLG